MRSGNFWAGTAVGRLACCADLLAPGARRARTIGTRVELTIGVHRDAGLSVVDGALGVGSTMSL